MDIHVIPLDVPAASYSEMPVTLKGVTYTLTMRWNYRSQQWTADWQSLSGQPIASGMPLRTGRNAFAGIGPKAALPSGAFTVFDTTGANADPGINSFATTHKLIFVSRA